MSEEKQEGQKTVVSFVVGLLIGGLLVWAFSGPTSNAPTRDNDDKKDTNTEEIKSADDSDETTKADSSDAKDDVPAPKATLPVGDGKISVDNQSAGSKVALASATYPVSEGWVGVRDYTGGQLGSLLGAVRFSEEQGLVPTEIVLQRPTTSGNEYAVVVYKENGDRQLNLAEDVQIDTIFSTFTAE
jgi:hypothetical protein